MTSITYVLHDGTEHVIEVENGVNLMEAATTNMVPGIEGLCGGICSCATCHGYIPEEWADKVGERGVDEEMMLEGAEDVRENSRLCCQIYVSDSLDGLRVYLPESQG